jgi:LEA14-like dessication related protein
MRNLLWIGGALVALYLIGRTRLATNVKVLFRGLSFGGGLRKPSISLRFGVQNPTDQTATVRSIVGQVDANGRTVADVSGFQALQVGPNTESILTVQAQPAAVGIVQTVAEFLRQKERGPVRVTFTGTANVDGVNLPINSSVNL